jgi:hypothetical protein
MGCIIHMNCAIASDMDSKIVDNPVGVALCKQ